ncbi:hypothetical protein [Paraburkholderia humisilvae]|uniref:Uncharacterized protein n=1 Tax=Paraburkholderia humisilvae TaxID=627669 RepID=A0A6J5DP21_9BURK|nr:hypothetical protein [Paraburkholderia humisilvae]CAB3754735.1 hypothetical protein LMG29542_02439 [Paraburkholderia humisilvae]
MTTALGSQVDAANLIRKGLSAEKLALWPQRSLPRFMLEDLADQEMDLLGIKRGHRVYEQRRKGVLEELGQPVPTIELSWGRIIARYDDADSPPSFALVFAFNSPEGFLSRQRPGLGTDCDIEAIQFAIGKVLETKFADIERSGAELTDSYVAGEILKFEVLDTSRTNFKVLSESIADFVEHYDMIGMLADESVVLHGNEASARRYVAHGWVA